MSDGQLYAIASKADNDVDPYTLKAKCAALAIVNEFKVPAEGLRVGTLDSLMSLSDDLVKLDMLAEGTAAKIYRQLFDLTGDEPTINGVKVETYAMRQFEWDEAKFQMKTPLRELSESISGRIAGLDEELKTKVTEVNNLKGILQGYDRKTQGNLLVRSLVDVVTNPDDVLETEYMTTMMMAIPKHSSKEFLENSQTMSQYVVPRSAKLLYEDLEYGLYRVVVFKKSAEDFKAAARDRRYTIRDFSFEATKQADEAAKKETDKAEFDRLKGLLTNWCKINFAEAFTMMMHLKAIRIFVESVLRYGLKAGRPNFKAFVLMPNKGKHDALRKLLAGLFGGVASMMDGEEETTVPGATGEFFPYVSVTIETAPVLS
jgi:V-type H+-transporting ATPase subunit C